MNTRYVTKAGGLEDMSTSTIPVLTSQQPNFPRNKNPFAGRKGQEITWNYAPREFFLGHRYSIILVGYVQNSSQLISLDNRGYIYLWSYDKNSFTSELNFKPTEKLKLELNSIRFLPEESTRIFPIEGDKEINPKTTKFDKKTTTKLAQFKETIDATDIKERAVTTYKDAENGSIVFFVPQNEDIQKFGYTVFFEYIFNSQGMCIRLAENKYQSQPENSKIISAKLTSDKSYMVVYLLKNHQFSIKNREMHEFVIINIKMKKLNTVKMVLDYEKGTQLIYDVSSEIPPYNLPYLYIIQGPNLLI